MSPYFDFKINKEVIALTSFGNLLKYIAPK